MRRLGWEILGALMFVAAGIAVGWQIRGERAEAKSREREFFVQLDRIATHQANLDLLCSNRIATARRLSEDRMFEALNRADEILTANLRLTNAPAIPNLTEFAWRATYYAKSNGAPAKTIERAEHLNTWLHAQQVKAAG